MTYDQWKAREPDTVTIWDEIRASNASDNLPSVDADKLVEDALHLTDFLGDLVAGMSNAAILNLAGESISQIADDKCMTSADIRMAVDKLACEGERRLMAREQKRRDEELDAIDSGWDYDGDID